jgi:solute carrier family 13 (sodium-dependent dicarboxylate transporter), member 2/3/5
VQLAALLPLSMELGMSQIAVERAPALVCLPRSGDDRGRTRWAVALACALAGAACGWRFGGALPADALVALAVFAAALVGWAVLRLDETQVAIGGALVLVALGVVEADRLYAALGNDLTWLLLGGFVLAAVLQASGLAERWTLQAARGAGTFGALMQRLTWLIAATAFVVPSTSARAALLLPVFLVLARTLASPRQVRALALLFPTVILLSAGASLLGAGAHLIAIDTLRRLGLPTPGFLGWMVLAAPLCALACWAACGLVGRLFLRADERRGALDWPAEVRTPLRAEQRRTAWVVGLGLLGLAGSGGLGIDAALVVLAVALLATVPAVTGVALKTALKKVEWNLLLFLAATLVMGQALLDSGAAAALAAAATRALPAQPGAPLLVAAVAAVALLSHLLITSRSARALVLIPVVALPLSAAGANPAVLVLVSVLGSGFCQTLAVSAKPVMVFARAEVPTFGDADLLRLSAALLPVVFALLMLFALVIWPWQGLPLQAG